MPAAQRRQGDDLLARHLHGASGRRVRRHARQGDRDDAARRSRSSTSSSSRCARPRPTRRRSTACSASSPRPTPSPISPPRRRGSARRSAESGALEWLQMRRPRRRCSVRAKGRDRGGRRAYRSVAVIARFAGKVAVASRHCGGTAYCRRRRRHRIRPTARTASAASAARSFCNLVLKARSITNRVVASCCNSRPVRQLRPRAALGVGLCAAGVATSPVDEALLGVGSYVVHQRPCSR